MSGWRQELEPPIETDAAHADELGRHYARLHTATTQAAYQVLGVEVKTGYQVDVNGDGSRTVHIIEEHGLKE